MENYNKPDLDFMGIGFIKCGTTWLYDCLSEHPEVCMSHIKETRFFVNNDILNDFSRIENYKHYFDGCKRGQLKGEFSPQYIESDLALKQIKEFYPDIKFILMLRNPVERAISKYFFDLKYSEKDIKRQVDKDILNKYPNSQYYFYYNSIKKWFNHFPSQNIHIIILEEASINPKENIKKLYSFLGIDSDFIPQGLNKQSNKAHVFYFPNLQKIFSKSHHFLKKRPAISKFLKRVRPLYRLKEKIRSKNIKYYNKPEISLEVKAELQKKFQSEVEGLENFLNRDLSIWK